MKTHPFGDRSGLAVPYANIGAMRLPDDLDAAVALVRHAIDRGMIYIDTCRRYGDSELKLAEALKDGYRARVILSSKWAPWVMGNEPEYDTSADFLRRKLEESLERLQVDYLDFYQLWSVQSRECWAQATAKGGMLDGIFKAKEEGLIRHIGFTTHDSVDNVLSYIEEADWCEAILFTYNLRSRGYGPAIAAARAKGIATIIMNPVGGGTLAQPHPHLERLAREVGAASVPELALRWLISHDAIDAYVCGISRLSDVDEAIAAAERGPFTAAQMARIEATAAALERGLEAYCTGCGYCRPCPAEIDIPEVMAAISWQRFLGDGDAAAARYRAMTAARADACTRCGACESRCTQHLPIIEEMAYAAEAFR